MLREFLSGRDPERVRWSDSMPGVRVCCFDLGAFSAGRMQALAAADEPFRFEVIFCRNGRVIAELGSGGTSMVEGPGVFLISRVSGMRSFRVSGDLRGVLVSVDAKAARDSFFSVCTMLGIQLDTGRVKARMEARQGCAVLSGTPWTQATFQCLESLPEDARGQYCVFKAVELLYLLCAGDPAADPDQPSDGYITQSVLDAKLYMQAHLSEKITIQTLSRMFSVSPTFLKTGFRRMFGQPIHSWLVEQRMKRARDLICSTDLPVQEIAQAVGYDGMSQFNAAFKQRYGTTPGRFRKMSKAAIPRPF